MKLKKKIKAFTISLLIFVHNKIKFAITYNNHFKILNREREKKKIRLKESKLRDIKNNKKYLEALKFFHLI